MKLNHKSSILTACGLLFIMVCIPMTVRADPPPPPGDYVANSYDCTQGTITSGNLQSTWYNDGQYLTIKTVATFVIVGWRYDAYIKFDFSNLKYDKIKFDFIDTIGYGKVTVNIGVIYETGDPDYFPTYPEHPFGYVSDGYYEYNLDSSRKVSYARISLYCVCFEWPERYLKIDMIRLTILG